MNVQRQNLIITVKRRLNVFSSSTIVYLNFLRIDLFYKDILKRLSSLKNIKKRNYDIQWKKWTKHWCQDKQLVLIKMSVDLIWENELRDMGHIGSGAPLK